MSIFWIFFLALIPWTSTGCWSDMFALLGSWVLSRLTFWHIPWTTKYQHVNQKKHGGLVQIICLSTFFVAWFYRLPKISHFFAEIFGPLGRKRPRFQSTYLLVGQLRLCWGWGGWRPVTVLPFSKTEIGWIFGGWSIWEITMKNHQIGGYLVKQCI